MASISNAIKMVVSGDASGAKAELDAVRAKMAAFAQDTKGAGNEGIKSFKLMREGLAGIGIITVLTQMRALATEIRNMPGVPDNVREGMESFANGFDSITSSIKVGLASVITFFGRVGEGIRSLVDSEFEADRARLKMEAERAAVIEANHKRGMEQAKEIADARERSIKTAAQGEELLRKVSLEAIQARVKAQEDADRKTRDAAQKIKGDMMTQADLMKALQAVNEAILADEREIKKTKQDSIEYDRILVRLTENRATQTELVKDIEAQTVGTLNEQYAANLRLAGLNDQQIQQIMTQNGLLKEQLATETAITEQRRLGFQVRNATDPFEMTDEQLAEKIANLQAGLQQAERSERTQIGAPGGGYILRTSPGFRSEIERLEQEQETRRRFRSSYEFGTASSRFSAFDYERFERQYVQNGGTDMQKQTALLESIDDRLKDRMPVAQTSNVAGF